MNRFPSPAMSADAARLPAVTSPAIVASLTTFAMLIPIAAPTPVAELTVEPSAVISALLSVLLVSARWPPTLVASVE
jgi:hypothetical protein